MDPIIFIVSKVMFQLCLDRIPKLGSVGGIFPPTIAVREMKVGVQAPPGGGSRVAPLKDFFLKNTL